MPTRFWKGAAISVSLLAAAAVFSACGRADSTSSTAATVTGSTQLESTSSVSPTSRAPQPGTHVDDTSLVEPQRTLAIGESAVSGELEVVVRRIVRARSINGGLKVGRFVLVDVSLRAVGGSDQQYGPLDWRLVTADGHELQPAVYADSGKLDFGVLEPSSTVEGTLAFDVGEAAVVAVRYQREPREGPSVIWAVTPRDLRGA